MAELLRITAHAGSLSVSGSCWRGADDVTKDSLRYFVLRLFRARYPHLTPELREEETDA